jgi:LemA protein
MNKTVLIVLGVIVLIVLIIGGAIFGSYNSLVTKQQAVKASWSEVENQMQRRADLIPNIVATVKGVAGLEERVFTRIAEARSQLLSTMQNPNSTTEDKVAADGKLTQAMRDGGLLGTGGRFLSIAENYPQLKSNESFLKLQDELSGTESAARLYAGGPGLQHFAQPVSDRAGCGDDGIQRATVFSGGPGRARGAKSGFQ